MAVKYFWELKQVSLDTGLIEPIFMHKSIMDSEAIFMYGLLLIGSKVQVEKSDMKMHILCCCIDILLVDRSCNQHSFM